MKNLVLAIGLVFGAQAAKAEDNWLCAMTYKAHVQAVQVVVGKFVVEGTGNLRCENQDGDTQVIPVRLSAKGAPVAARIAIGDFNIYGASANINLGTRQPEELFGKYRLIQAQAVVAGGAGVVVGTHVGDESLTLHLSVNAIEGIGFNFGLSTITVEPQQ